MNLMFAEWANRGLNQWTIKQRTLSLVKSDGEYDLGTDIIDVLSVVVRRDNTDFSVERISRDTYLSIPNKTTEGRTNQFFLDRQITPNLKIWPVPENSTDVIYYDALTRVDDADTQVNTLDVPFRFYPCLAAGLAYYIAMKKHLKEYNYLKQLTKRNFKEL